MHLVNQIHETEIKSYLLILNTIAKECSPPAQGFCLPVKEIKLFNNLFY